MSFSSLRGGRIFKAVKVLNKNIMAVAALVCALLCAAGFYYVAFVSTGADNGPEAGRISAPEAVNLVRNLDECNYYHFIVTMVLSSGGRIIARTEDLPSWVDRPDSDTHYWFVVVGEELGEYFEAWKHLAVDSHSGAVFVFDLNGRQWIALDEWRHRRQAA